MAPALLILYLGGNAFIGSYPRAPHRSTDQGSRASGPDSLLAFIHDGIKSDSLTRNASINAVPARENPFRPIHGPNFAAEHAQSGPKIEPPARKYVLKGTVGFEVATIADHTGRKLIVKVGDGVDSAVVVSIEPNKVILKDRAGKFELLQEK